MINCSAPPIPRSLITNLNYLDEGMLFSCFNWNSFNINS